MSRSVRSWVRFLYALAIVALVLPPHAPESTAVGPTSHEITSCAQLNTLGADEATRFDTLNLAADLDCTGVTFSPMYPVNGFQGVFNGWGHTISNFNLNFPTAGNVALFASATNATIRDVTFLSGSITANYFAGTLVGQVYNDVIISRVISHVDISSYYYTGGLVGSIEPQSGSVTVQDSSSHGVVTTIGGYSGGLIGLVMPANANVTVRRSFATGAVTATSDDNLGGLIGYSTVDATTVDATITLEDVYANGLVSSPGYSYLGGLVGYVVTNSTPGTFVGKTTVRRAYASGNVSGQNGIGAVFGYIGPLAGPKAVTEVTDTFGTGALTITGSFAGGIVGYYDRNPGAPATFSNTYYDQSSTFVFNCGQVNPVPNCTAVNISNSTPNYFKGNATNPPLASWDFAGTWQANAGDFPTLRPASDGDGSASATEAAGPNGGDANGDNRKDDYQPNVTSFVNPVTGAYLALHSSCGNVSSATAAGEPTASGQADVAYNYPAGLVTFTVTGCTPGTTSTITQYFYGVTPGSFALRKANAGRYTTIPGAQITNVTIGGQPVIRAQYQITDGSALDADGLSNGTIVDPAGLAVLMVGAPNTGGGGLAK